MARPSVLTATERLLEVIGDDIMRPDVDHDWVFLKLLDAMSVNREQFEALFRARGGRVGFAAFLDPDTCPDAQLPSLAPWTGATVTPAMTAAEMRTAIIERPGLRRGAPGRIAAAVRTTLAGARTVTVEEVDAWNITIRTYAAETPDPEHTLAVASAASPAWVLPTHLLLAGQTIGDVAARFATLADVDAAYASLQELLEDIA